MPPINITGKSLKFWRDALNIYLQYLKKHSLPGNTVIGDEAEKVGHSFRRITEELRETHRKGHEGFDFDASFSDQCFSLVKALLPFLKKQYERERDKIVQSGAPTQATESIDSKLLELERIIAWPIWERVKSYDLINENLLPEEERLSPPVPLIINNHDGIVAFGNHNIIVQENHSSASEELQKLIEAIRKSELPQSTKGEAEAEIITIEAQLAKKQPDKTIIQRAFFGLKTLLVGGELLGLAVNVHTVLHALGLL
ncbi:MAG: hypothetical protein Q7S29_00190 [Candidatus Peribacter sp.]|nr:hypothetical protein [Candidatus Peribacter sp.]